MLILRLVFTIGESATFVARQVVLIGGATVLIEGLQVFVAVPSAFDRITSVHIEDPVGVIVKPKVQFDKSTLFVKKLSVLNGSRSVIIQVSLVLTKCSRVLIERLPVDNEEPLFRKPRIHYYAYV